MARGARGEMVLRFECGCPQQVDAVKHSREQESVILFGGRCSMQYL